MPRNRKILFGLLSIITLMIGLTAASVPLYRLFCAATGLGGTTQRKTALSANVAARLITVRFNTDTARDLPWRFIPKQNSMQLAVGANGLAYFIAENNSDQPVTGRATYNVTPDKAGLYFDKVQCFCFTEQRLAPHQRVEMPVQFYIDPAMLADHELDDVTTITLSYTFFRAVGDTKQALNNVGG